MYQEIYSHNDQRIGWIKKKGERYSEDAPVTQGEADQGRSIG
jgi:hypothetical protein